MARVVYDFQSPNIEYRDWKEARAMSRERIQSDGVMFESRLDAMESGKVEQIVNATLDAEADEIADAVGYERNGAREAHRTGRYERKLTARAGGLELKAPKLKGAIFRSAVIERYRRREQSVEESPIGMYLAGSPPAAWTTSANCRGESGCPPRPCPTGSSAHGEGSVGNVSVPASIGVDAEGRREVIGAAEGMKEAAASWRQFVRSMIERGLKGVRLVAGDRCAGLVSTVNEMLPKAGCQRCAVHFMRNVLSKVPPSHRKWASGTKAVFAMESRHAALDKAETVASEMEPGELRAAAGCLGEGIGETAT